AKIQQTRLGRLRRGHRDGTGRGLQQFEFQLSPGCADDERGGGRQLLAGQRHRGPGRPVRHELPDLHRGQVRPGSHVPAAGLHRLCQPAGRPDGGRAAGHRGRADGGTVRQRRARRRERPPDPARHLLHRLRRGRGHHLRPEVPHEQEDQRDRPRRRGDRRPVVLLHAPWRQAGDRRRGRDPDRHHAEQRGDPVRRRDPHSPAVRHLRERCAARQDSGARLPVGQRRFILTGIVIVAAAALAAAYKWTKFGLATRAAAENEAAAMLSGLSPNLISLTNTLLASLVAGALGILAASITQLDPQTLPLQIIPALAAALIAQFTSFGVACAAAIGIGILDSLVQYASAQSWFPQSGGVALPGVTDLLAFAIIVVVLFWRGSRIPGRGEVVERRLPEAPRPRHLWRTALICGLVGAVLLIIFPFDFREALINTLIGAVMALSLVVITGFVVPISIIPLALA